MSPAVVLGRDLEIPMADVTIQVLVLDAHVGELDVVIVVRQVVLACPFLDLLAAPIRPAVAVPIAPVPFLEEALVVAFQLAIELHAQDAGVLLAQTFRFLQVGAIQLRIVRPLAGPAGAGVEGLPMVAVAVAPVAFEEPPASLGQHRRTVGAVERHTLDQPLPFQVPQIVPCVEGGIPRVSQVAVWDHAKCPDRRKRARVEAAQRVLAAIALVDELPLATVRQVQPAHEHVAMVNDSALVLAITHVAIAVVARVLAAIAGVGFHGIVADGRRTRSASQDEPLLLAVANAVVAAARVAVSGIAVVEHEQPLGNRTKPDLKPVQREYQVVLRVRANRNPIQSVLV